MPTQRLVVCLCIVLSGCGQNQPLGKVFGKVTSQGQPLIEGQVLFNDAGRGIYMTADIQPDGTYVIVGAQGSGLPPGNYLAAVTPPPPDIPIGSNKPKPRKSSYPEIPEKYHALASSGLKVVVQAGDNEFNIDMRP